MIPTYRESLWANHCVAACVTTSPHNALTALLSEVKYDRGEGDIFDTVHSALEWAYRALKADGESPSVDLGNGGHSEYDHDDYTIDVLVFPHTRTAGVYGVIVVMTFDTYDD